MHCRILIIAGLLFCGETFAQRSDGQPKLRKLQDIVIYEDAKFYAAFPSMVRRPNGDLLVAFRRAPERRALGESSAGHTDPNSYLVLVRSRDDGKTWTREPELIYAHPFGGSQDPCMVPLRDGTILCASYAWARMQPNAIAKLKQPISRHGDFVFLGGFLVRSQDGARTWQGPIIPPPCQGEANLDIFGNPVPAYNRGAMCEGKDKRLFWAVASSSGVTPKKSGVHLMISPDKGNSWQYSCPIAQDPKIEFNETSLYETPKSDLVAFVRSEGFNDHTVIARSKDHGKSFVWEDSGFQGHPHYALPLPDNRVLLVYGYRHAPFGIRARVLDSECTNAAVAEEFVLRDDGGNGDLGYPWATMVSKNRALVVYYFNRADGT
ncbi:MAG TPA: sialidase family protein, partial [Verrucomicrobiae bacterium]